MKRNTCIYLECVLSYEGCGIIALKREITAYKVRQVFRGANAKLENWRQVTVPIREAAMLDGRISVEPRWDTHGNVYNHRLSYLV